MITFGKTTEEAARAPFLLKTQELESAGISFTVALPVFGEAGSAVIAGTDRKIQDLLRKCTPISPDYENAYECWKNYAENVTAVEFIDTQSHYFQTDNADELVKTIKM